MSSSLCGLCRSVFIDRDLNDYKEGKDTEPIFTTFTLLAKSAADGCLMCSQFLNRLTPQERESCRKAAKNITKNQDKGSFVCFGLKRQYGAEIDFTVQFTFPPSSLPWQRHRLLPAARVEPRIDQRKISSYTGSSESLATAAKWLKSCIAQHPSCTTSSTAFNPTRLIDLGLRDNTVARLYEVPGGCGKLPYLTLSHCWGGTIPYKLTDNNLNAMKTVIPLSELSKTLQDAIFIVRKLGFQYLWADTLCIIQDSKTDWQAEAKRMGQIYRNSICTIAASAASNGDDGCFFTRDSQSIKPCKIANRTCGDFYMTNTDFWDREIEDAPLNQRAWVLQELLLSPRTLHFGNNQIFYTCAKLHACEAFPKGLPRGIRDGSVRLIYKELIAKQHNHSWANAIWNRIIEYYSKRKLTKSGDKLVAVSALAKEMRPILNSEYLAGIWQNTLPGGLLWSTAFTNVADPAHRPEYRAPSWSWASIDCEIFPFEKYEEDIEIAEVQEVVVTSDVGDTTTQVTNGFIRLKGRLMKCWYDRGKSLLFGELWGVTSQGEQMLGIFTSVQPDYDGPQNEIVRDLYCFPIMLMKEFKSSPEPSIKHCLLLQRAEEKGTFTRFGKYSSGSQREREVDSVKEACDFFDATTDKEEWDYEETEDGKIYTITII